jgi:riboflavin synthase, alpha subunit
MFTGIVYCLGDIAARSGSGRESRFTIVPRKPFTDTEVGESISVNGVCLTAEAFSGGAFTAYASEETLTASALASLKVKSVVNLERAVAVGTRLGGHIVSGHVDCVAKVASVAPRGGSTAFTIAFPAAMAHLVVPKGSVTLDGISLTVNECGTDFLTVNIIPETMRETIIHQWRAGTAVNMEADIIGKYVARMVETGFMPQGMTPRTGQNAEAGQNPGLTMDFLRENGF